MPKRRHLLIAGAGGAAALAALRFGMPAPRAADAHFEVMHTEAEWRALLTPQQYNVCGSRAPSGPLPARSTRRSAPASSPAPAASLPLFASDTKFDSRTGWPSFWKPLDNAVATEADNSLRHEPRRGALPPLRRPSRPRLQRRAAADRPALLHERCCHDLHTPCRLRNRSMDKAYPVTRSDAEWRKLLTPEQYYIMREHGTERPGSCALLVEKRPGKFTCAGCGKTLFESGRSSRAAPAGRASTSRSRAASRPRSTTAWAWSAPRSIARPAAAIWDTSSTTARRRPISATASTAWR